MSNGKTTKTVLVENIVNRLENPAIEKADVLNIIDLLLDEVKKSLIDGKSIELRGFGTLELRLRKGKNAARNPKTGDIVTVAPHYVAAFRSGQELKHKLWILPIQDSDK